MAGRFIALTPTYSPVGGVVKIFDYVNHARRLGMDVQVYCPRRFAADLPVFQSDRFAHLPGDRGVEFIQGHRIGIRPADVVFFSWPTDWQRISTRLPSGMAHERVIHIIQNIRHANPTWIHGYGTRLLARPMSRIMIAPQVDEAIRPFVHRSSPAEVILEGHDWPYFSKERSGGLGRPVRVAYTTWKSQVGVEVEDRLSGDGEFEFRSIRSTVGWPELRELYHWADVFLATPFAEEGFYLPGLEAMAAGALVVSSDAGGNRAYCEFGVNCLHAELDDASSYVAALVTLSEMPDDRVTAMRRAAYTVLEQHTLEAEADHFGRFLDQIEAMSTGAGRQP